MKLTEALQELVTLGKRIEKKREFVADYLINQGDRKDPLDKQGGSEKAIAEQMQAISDLENNIIELRQKIAATNAKTEITVCGVTKTIEQWLIWKRDVAPNRRKFLATLHNGIKQNRDAATGRGFKMVRSESEADNLDLIVYMDETELLKEREQLEEIYSTLDGQLSMKNATVDI